MKTISKLLLVLTLLLSFTACEAQIKNPKTATVKIYGNCNMCKKTIENAGNISNIAKVNWDVKSKLASLTFDTLQTNSDEILQRIAKSGYDSENHLAPNEAYSKLPDCCQYSRNPKALQK